MRKTRDKVLVCDAQDISIYEHPWGSLIAMLESSTSLARWFYGLSSLHFLVIVRYASAISLLWILHHLKADDPIESVCSLSLSFINARLC